MSGAILRRRDRIARSLRVVHYSSAVNRQGWAKAAREKLNAIIEDAHFPSPAEPAEVPA